MAFKSSRTNGQLLLVFFSSLVLSGMPCTMTRCVAQLSSSFILQEYKSNLANLKSGQCTVSFNPSLKQRYNGAQNALVRFSPQGLRIESRYLKDNAVDLFFYGRQNYEIPAATETLTGYYIRTNEKRIQWLEGLHKVEIDPSEAKTNQRRYVNVFDLRSFGLCCTSSLFKGRDVEVIVDWMSKLKADSVTEISPSVYEVKWSDSYPDGGASKWTITFDGNKGYSPVKQAVYERYSAAEAWRRTEISKATWIKKSGAWVPVKFTCRDHKVRKTWEFKLDWQSVNEAIPETLFGHEEFGLTPADIVSENEYPLRNRIELQRGLATRTPKNMKQNGDENEDRSN